MLTWALIIWIQCGYRGGATTVEGFGSQADCQAACAVVKQSEVQNGSTWGKEVYCACVPVKP